MTDLRRRGFERALARLDRASLAAFVADLWSARGWEIERRDGVVVVTDPATGDRRVLFVAAPGVRLIPERPPCHADAVVAVGRGPVAGAPDAARIDAGTLYEHTRYALDGADRERLLQEHVGGVPSRTVGERVGALADGVGDHRGDVALAVLLVGAILAAQLAAFTGAPVAEAGGGTATGPDGTTDAEWLRERSDLSHAVADDEPARRGAIEARAYVRYPVVARPSVVDGLAVVGRYDGTVAGHRPPGLSPAWERRLPGRIIASPAAGRGMVYVVTTGEGRNATSTLHGLAAADGTGRWSRTIDGVGLSPPAAARDAVYLGSARGQFRALDADTGRTRWSRAIGDVRSAPAVANGTVYAAGADGRLYALDAATGATRWTVQLAAGTALTAPVVAGDAVYVAGGGGLYAVDRVDGDERWRVGVDREPVSAPAAAAGTLFVSSRDGSVHAVNAATGKIRWTTRVNSRVSAAPVAVGGTVYVGSGGGNVYSGTAGGRLHALDAVTGRERWNVTTNGPIVAAPALEGGTLYAGDYYGWVYRVGGNATA